MPNQDNLAFTGTGQGDNERGSDASGAPAKMTSDELRSIIRREMDNALGIEGGRLSAERRTSLEYYEGEPFGDEVEGRSTVVMRSVMEAVEWVLPALLRIFVTSDKIAEFEPTREQDENAAAQATDYVSYVFYKDNPGFVILHDWFKDGLIQKLGWVKCFWNTQKILETNSFGGLTPEEFEALTSDPGVTVVEKREYPAPQAGGFDQDAPQPGATTLIDCTLRSSREEGRVKIEAVAPEEVLTSRRAKGVDDLPFVCHRIQRTVTDLIEQGFDRQQALRLQGYDEQEYNTERIVRYEKDDDFPYQTDRTDPAMRLIWVEESYMRVDWDGDGVAELRKITTAGNAREILIKANGELDNEEIDEVPLIPITPIRMPHKLVGMSISDVVMDLQLIRSVIVRQMLDNLYLSNAPRAIVEDGACNDNTYDDLLTVRPGGLIRAQNAAGIVPWAVPFVADKAFPVLQYFDQIAEQRSGVAPHNQNVDSDVIKQSSSGLQTHLMQQAAAQRVELIARVFAETGVKELCKRILGLVTRYQQAERIIKLTGKWVPMDPRQWRNSMNVSVSVGLGTGNRDQILGHLLQILQVQQGIIMVQKGIAGPLVTAKNVFDVVERLTENAGFKESFFTDPAAPPQQGQGGPQPPPPPDPEMMKAQQDMQLQQTRVQADLALQKAKADQEMQIAVQRAQLEAQLEQQKAQHAMELERMREDAKQGLAMRELELKAQAGAFTPAPPQPQGVA